MVPNSLLNMRVCDFNSLQVLASLSGIEGSNEWSLVDTNVDDPPP